MRIAALDLGTNSFHLLVADAHPDGTFTPLVSEKETLRLGEVVTVQGVIPDAIVERIVATVRRFHMLAESSDADETVACATSALRTATNGGAIVDRIAAETGVAVEVISGQREAALIFEAVRASVLIDPGPALCFDLGGGSVEISVGDASGLHWATSERLGVGRLTADYVTSDPLSIADRTALRSHIIDVLTPVAKTAATFSPRLVVGSSGTLEDLARMVAERRKGSVPISLNQFCFRRSEFEPLYDRIVESKASERRKIAGLESRRVDSIPAGAVFLKTAMELFEFDEMTISAWALREGMVIDAIDRHDPADLTGDPRAIRRSAVHSLARRCNWPETHARKVAMLALEIFDQTTTLHHLGAPDRELLEYGALLHDIGEHIAAEDHELHAPYLIEHGRLRGFDPAEIRMLEAITRWHRRGDPKPSEEHFGRLDAEMQRRVRAIVAILRIADGLDRGRSQVVQHVKVQVSPSLVLLRVVGEHDNELEVWGARRKRELFEKVFQRELEIISPTGPTSSTIDPSTRR